ncbi:SMI1/KNR4 family protein [Massilia sp. CCM 8734]|uniref:SMI1/KNR4 family protein n=1 Tax=Massilia sp. CCM 8734 TaxID=2609283 RepID=UPI00142270D5|nr:SMI1/KNR4 family protein [Massilia sp. CCM 8734]NIA00224.1 hypothetical protein [Massilia sp. CCM 8734]
MTTELLHYLEKYCASPSIVALSDSGSGMEALPAEWIDLLSLEGKERISYVIALWERFGEGLSEVTDKLKSSLVSVDLLKEGDTYSLLYGVSAAERILYYQAKNPICRKFNSKICSLWPRVPQSIRDFYAVHDGWFYLASHSMGLLPAEELFVLSDEDWGILDEIGLAPVNLDKTIAFFTNGMSGYVCLDVSPPKEECAAMIWWSNKLPKMNLKFWDIIDSWTAIGLNG